MERQPPCAIGQRPGLARDHERHTGAQLEAASVIELAKRGEEAASATLARYEQRLARALASVINVPPPSGDQASTTRSRSIA